jgi:uncharacterized RDD family membrane protein YckC
MPKAPGFGAVGLKEYPLLLRRGCAIGRFVNPLMQSSADNSAADNPSQRPKRREADVIPGSLSNHDLEWRGEVASRVEKYRIRRRRGFDPDLSLRLNFEAQRQANRSMLTSAAELPHSDSAEHKKSSAAAEPASEVAAPLSTAEANDSALPAAPAAAPTERAAPPRPVRMRKIIEFPRPAALFEAPVNELAEPVLDTPRILEAPDVTAAELLPAVPAITLDAPAEVPHADDLEVPLQPASLVRRFAAALLDLVSIAAAYALFLMVVIKIAPITLASFKLRAGALAAAANLMVIWAAYHYLFLVFGAVTPGMKAARLEIRAFDERLVTRRLRRWRFVSLLLSCFAAGLGFAWVLLDEDSLGWHDRMSHTYLAYRHSTTGQ